MKQVSKITTGILANISLIMGLIVLFRQPFSTITNDRLFAALFLVGCLFTIAFLRLNRDHKNPLYTHNSY